MSWRASTSSPASTGTEDFPRFETDTFALMAEFDTEEEALAWTGGIPDPAEPDRGPHHHSQVGLVWELAAEHYLAEEAGSTMPRRIMEQDAAIGRQPGRDRD